MLIAMRAALFVHTNREMGLAARRGLRPRRARSVTLDAAGRKLTIKTLQEQLALLKIASGNYSKEFDEAILDQERQSLIARQWDAALRESRSLQFVLDSLELEEQKETPRS